MKGRVILLNRVWVIYGHNNVFPRYHSTNGLLVLRPNDPYVSQTLLTLKIPHFQSLFLNMSMANMPKQREPWKKKE